MNPTNQRRSVRASGERSTRLRDAALAAAASGLWVFPCVPRGKVPAVKAWEQTATRDPELIERWWRQRPFNIGAAVGLSGLIVIDLDQGCEQPAPEEFAGAKSGIDTLRMLAQRAGQPAPWDTYSVSSPTGGLHLYFRAPEGSRLRNTVGEAGLGWKIDTRAHGGFIVAAGSRRDEGLYRVANNAPIAQLPQWLSTALKPPEPERLAANTAGPPPAQVGAYLRAILAGESQAVCAAGVGERNHALNRAAFNLGRLIGGDQLDENTAWRVLSDAASVHDGIENFTETEARRTIASGLQAGRMQPRRLRK
jgi:hypothetical protein